MPSLITPAEFNRFRAASLNVMFESFCLQYEQLPLYIVNRLWLYKFGRSPFIISVVFSIPLYITDLTND